VEDVMTDCWIGIDVAKDELVVGVLPATTWIVANDERGIRELRAKLAPLGPTVIVLEATGGYELAVVAALVESQLPVVVVNPRQVRDFAKATGELAKTDALDALVLARFGERVRPAIRPLADDAQQALDALVTRRRQLLEMLQAEKNRAGQVFAKDAKLVRRSLTLHIRYLEKELGESDAALAQAIQASPVWREQEQLLRSVPGVGRVVATTLLAELPELGRLTRKEIAKLVGLAPMARDSGTFRGRRFIRGGRPGVRAALYMGTLVATRCNPTIRAFYTQLVHRGKPKKLALIACMRKLLVTLNAMVARHVHWVEHPLIAA
jgi:transposase